jgi:hypothetical protein
MIDEKDIIDYSIIMENNIIPSPTLGSNFKIKGRIEIKFSIELKCGYKNYNDLIIAMNNHKEIDIITSRGTLLGCLITGFDYSTSIDEIEKMSIEGIAGEFIEIIEVVFKDCVKKVKASTYNIVTSIIGKEITYEEYSKQALVEEI